ncbi:MAG: ATP-binding cassette domain-containing protein [Spirochaetaceae bacterium]|jgi:putative ABC transport system ATP-binding protein|nr:ATP-binding cassette domain-containing protein [Spirochaetaceae bacterium]
MIKIENLSVVFSRGTPDENIALTNINLNVRRGEFITIIGSNGAGKSTLYNAIAGTHPLAGGGIYVRGGDAVGWRDITNEPEYIRARYIGRIFQNPLLGTAGNMSLEDNMLICRKKGYKGLKISLNNQLREEFRTQLRILDMGLENRLTDNVGLLSGGQRQALTLLMTVMSRPALLLLDEHTAALDPRNAEVVMNLTLRFAAEYDLTVMMITHNMNHALKFGTRLLMMDCGEIILDMDKAEKEKLTVQGIAERFHDIRHQDLANDEMLLS